MWDRERLSERDTWSSRPLGFNANAWPTLRQQDELFAQLTAHWLTPYRPGHVHICGHQQAVTR